MKHNSHHVRWTLIAALTIVLLIVISCAPAAAPAQPAAPTTQAAAPTQAVATSAPAAPPIVLGVPTDLGTIEGADSLNSVKLAVDEINAKGGVTVGGVKRLFQVESLDTREAGANIPINDALQATEKLILEKKPSAIVVGNFRSEVLLAAMDLMPKYKIPYIATIAATPTLQQKVTEDPKYKYFFRLGLNAQGVVMYLTQALDFMGKNLNLKRAYVVYQDVAWSQGTRAGVTAWLKANGWETVGDDVYPVGATEFTTSLTKAKDGKADVLIPIFDMPQSGILLKQARAMNHPALMAGFISPAAPASAAKTFGDDLEGEVNIVFEIGSLPVKAVPASVQYNEAYGKKFGEDARIKLSGHGPGPSYDSVYVLKAAIERANSLDGDALVTALEATDIDGVIGHIKFGKDHQVVFGLDPKTTALGAAFQWVKGARVPVFPAAISEGKIQLPSK